MWITTERGTLLNLSLVLFIHIKNIEAREKWAVNAYTTDEDGDWIRICEGTKEKCERALKQLQEAVNPWRLLTWEEGEK